MNVLILGSGAKDHALAWWFSKSLLISELFIAPGNFATDNVATTLPDLDISDSKAVYAACRAHDIDYVFIGTENPVFHGVVRYLNGRGIRTFGATEAASRLEGDKSFSRLFLKKYRIRCPEGRFFDNIGDLEKFLKENKGKRFVIKSNQVAPSRVMLTSSDISDLLKFASSILVSGSVLLEDEIKGVSASSTLFLDGENYLALPLTGDYTTKSPYEDVPTGGMGALCPLPLPEYIYRSIREEIIEPVLKGMKNERMMYKGILTLSLVLANDGPYLVDFHMRFNDPSAQAIIPLLKTDAAALLIATMQGKLNGITLETNDYNSVAVVLASEGYPMNPKVGRTISGITPQFLFPMKPNPMVFCGAMVKDLKGKAVTVSGRNITVVGIGPSLKSANMMAYKLIQSKNLEGLWYRDDIGDAYLSP